MVKIMKHLKTYEDKNNDNLGKKIQDLMYEHGLAIYDIEEDDYLGKNNILFPDRPPFNETSDKEYRVYLGRPYSIERFKDEFYADNLEDALKTVDKWVDGTEDEMKSMWKKIKNKETENFNISLEFSVFFPSDKSMYRIWHSDKKELVVQAIWLKVAAYMKLLKISIPEVYKNILDSDEALTRYTEEYKKFLKNYNIEISLDNIEDAVKYAYRFYKDSKFFESLDLELPSGQKDLLIKDLLKII